MVLVHSPAETDTFSSAYVRPSFHQGIGNKIGRFNRILPYQATSTWTTRRALIAAALLAAGVLLGVGVTALVGGEDTVPEEQAESIQVAPPPTSSESIELGDPDPEPPPNVPALNAISAQFREVADRARPSVVFIRVENDNGEAALPDDGFHNEGAPMFNRRRTSAGSGVIISAEGHVVTSGHVVDDASRIRVLLEDKREYDAELVGTDLTTDLAVIRLIGTGEEDDAPLPVAALGDSDRVEVGEWVLAIGNPFRLTGTVTAGIVSALSRQVDVIDDSFRIEDFIQTDAAINPGNSGGALVNTRGEAIAIISAIATESGSYEGYAFAVPINLVERVVLDLIDNGRVERGYLGVEIRAVTAADARELGLDAIEGVLIASVAEGGAAEAAGIRERDVLLEVDGVDVNAPNQFQSRVALRRPGEEVELSVWRDGEERDMVTELIGRDDEAFTQWLTSLDERPSEPFNVGPEDVAPHDIPRTDAEDWGVRFRDLTPNERRTFGVSAGAFVEQIAQGSAADVDGLPSGCVVTRIENRPVASAEEALVALATLAERGDPALLRVRRTDGLTAFYDLASPFVD